MSPRYADLGPLETEVFGLLDDKTPLSVEAVQEKLRRKGNDLAYTTVMTVLTRLHGKQFVARRKEGRQFVYWQAGHAEAVRQSRLMRVKASLFGRSRLKPILALLDEEESLSVEELNELRQVVDRKLKQKENE